MILAATFQAALACPDDGGPTCGGGGAPASQRATATVNIGAGNPINVMTGNKYQREDDLPALPGVLGLEIVRHYNSRYSGPGVVPGVVGRGWKLSYETELTVTGDTIRVYQADGSSFMFRRDLVNQAVANSADPANGSIAIHRNRNGRDEYLWRWTDGRELSFDQRGKLAQIKAASGEIVSLLYDAQGLLVKVTDPQGRSLHLAYLDRQLAARGDRFRGVQSIDSPVGRFSYEYGNPVPKVAAIDQLHLLANLVRVRYPAAGAGRQYHYEDAAHPTYLTGVTLERQGPDGKPTAQRYSTFGYQADGRAVLSTHANNVDKVSINFERPGLTVVTNSLGQQTVYRYATVADDFRLLEVRGAGCALCGPANVRYGYDKLGRLVQTSRLNARGDAIEAVRNELDYSGRVLASRRIDYRDGRESGAQLLARYEYAAGGTQAPSLMVQPSVVPGKEAGRRYTFNAQGQRLSMTESGWSPAVGPEDAAQPISRTTRYGYRVINGRSLLVMIDGPLANGPAGTPADSDITLIDYDTQGRVQKMTAPGNVITEVVRRDDAGRPATVTQSDGSRVLQQQVTRDAHGAVTQVRQTAWLLEPAGSGQPAHVNAASKLVRQMDAHYNARGQLLAMQLPAFSWDTTPAAGSGRPEPAAADAEPAATAAAGAPDNGLRLRHGEDGSSASGAVLEVFTQAGSGAGAPWARRWLDDFGRLVAVQYQGQGISRASYGEHGAGEQAATVQDPRGNLARMRYDLQGRLTELVRSDAAGKPEQRIVLRYSGALLAGQTVFDAGAPDHPASIIRKEYDAFGQLLLEEQSGTGYVYGVHHSYDEAGRVQRTWLTQGVDGDTRTLPAISYAYQALSRLGDRIAAIDAGDGWLGRRSVVSALRWLLPAQRDAGTTPADYAPQLPVAAGWRWGNGLQASSQFEPVTVKDAARPWRLTGYHDGLHAYTVHSSEDGWILGVFRAGVKVAGGHEPDAAATPSAPSAPAAPADLLDDAGNRRWQAAGLSRYELVWNAAGQLVQVRAGAREVASYRYDAQGRRIAKTVAGDAGASRRFIYSGMQLAAEAGADGRILRQYVYLGQRPVAWIAPAQTLMERVRQFLSGPAMVYLHTDHRGAVTAASAPDQHVLWQDGGTAAAERFEQPLRMAGQYADAETGLSYNMARYYDPRSAAFISPDPAGLAAGSLDLYAYAGGDTLNYFDPDGWAKLTYYAITAGANGSTALGSNQGFTKARWAFVITDIDGGIKKNVVYDPTGGFVRSSFQGNQGDAYAWNAGDPGGDPVEKLKQYYGTNLISMNEFTIDDFSDDNAKGILSALGYPDPSIQACLSSMLPPIPFAPGEAAIDVTKRVANGANRQRILNCGREQQSTVPVQYADDTERDRVEKYEAAAEMNETSMLGKDCSQSGCPGVSINGQAGAVYHASYGRSQFTVNTFLATINGLTAAEKATIGVTPDIQSRITSGIARSNAVGQGGTGLFDAYRNAYKKCSDAPAAWDNAGHAGTPTPLTLADRAAFSTRTGLGRQAFIDMICFVPQSPARPIGEGRNAFMSEAIFTDATLKTWVMNIFKSDDKFGYISRVLIKKNLATVSGTSTISSNFNNDVAPTLPDGAANPAYAVRQRAIEEELAMRVARLHNGGKATALDTDLSILTRACIASGPAKNTPRCDVGSYVQKFIGIINDGHGDWRSLRCTADAKTGTGTDYSGRGLEFTPIALPSHH